MILVTGSNGFVGSHVVRLLDKRGERVRCFVRKNSNLVNLIEEQPLKCDVEFAYGDLRDPDSLKKALSGVKTVYHLASYVHLWYANPKEVYDINWTGTRNLFQAALEEGVDKVVFTSTAAILKGGTRENPSDEKAVLGLGKMAGHYARSKWLAYEEAVKYIKKGLPIVTVSLTTPVGEGDYNFTPPGKMILDYLNGRLPGYIDTVINYIDVGDVAAGHLLAEEKGKTGERYILGADNLTLEEVFGILSEISGRPKPKTKFSAALLLPLGFVSQKICQYVTHKEPLIPWEGLRLGGKPFAFDCSKAVKELGLPQGDVKDAFRRSAEWFYSKGYAKRGEKR
ncbi:MAG: SDR family oxidoreductase [Candidatus Omnitrophota bacterium]|jgi:dihydroflavonol-4-reductase